MIYNYFADLELGPDAGEDDVARAYRRLAKKFHPDLNANDPLAAAYFLKIQKAYEVLKKKQNRDALRKSMQGFEVDDTTFGRWNTKRLSGHKKEVTKTGTKTKARRLAQNQRIEQLDVSVDLEVSKKSKTADVRYEVDELCTTCRGKGASARSVSATCKACAGLGYTLIARGMNRRKQACLVCHQKGYVVLDACKACSGRAKSLRSERVRFDLSTIAESQRHGTLTLQLEGLGHSSFDQKTRGNLILKIKWIN